MKKEILVVLILFLLAIPGMKGQDDYFSTDYLRHQDWVYKDNIKSVELYREGWKMSPPVVGLKGGQKLILSFDDLEGDVKYYYYTIIHCDAMWQPSELRKNEYIRGFDEDEVRTFIRTGFEATRGCSVEVHLHEPMTVQGDLSRISRWVDIAVQEAERVAG